MLFPIYKLDLDKAMDALKEELWKDLYDSIDAKDTNEITLIETDMLQSI